jgi:hypothetical protein
MISSQQAETPSNHVRARAKLMHVRTLSPFTYLVIPEPGKVPRIVHFDACQDSGVVRIECYDRETGESCPANKFSLHCSHCEAAIKRLLANAKRAEKLSSAEPIERVKSVQEYAQKVIDETDQPDLKGIQK